MAVPKGKQSKSRTNKRFANYKATAPTLVECKHCHQLKVAHRVCPNCGWYYAGINNRAPAWTGVNELYNFLINNKGAGPRAVVVPLSEIREGDIVQIRFSGADSFAHSPVVVRAGRGTPGTVLVAAHTNDAYNRALNTYMYAELRPLHIL